MSENAKIAESYLFLIDHIFGENKGLLALIKNIDTNLTRAFKDLGVAVEIKSEDRGKVLITASNGVVHQNYENSTEFFSRFIGNDKFIEDFSKDFFLSFFDTYYNFKNNNPHN